MKITVKGKGTKTLNKRHFLASGGEGDVYALGDTVYKIYNDHKKMIHVSKIHELSVLNHKNIIRPIDVILDDKNRHVGYTMTRVNDTHALCQLFTKSFRDREGLDPETVFNLVQKIQKGVQYIHNNKILIVDCNEMNFLVEKDFNEVYFIDLDSYQTPNFPATALMESVRDRHMSHGKFNEGTDWFSWGIVTFQLFTGIHPYKGKHKTYKDLDARMENNISVFNNEVSVPKVVLPFDVIPQAYRNWYEAIFEKGIRDAPPDSPVETIKIVTNITKVMGTNKFDIEEIENFNDLGNIVQVIYHFGTRIVLTTRGLAVDKKRYKDINNDSQIGFTPKLNHVIEVKLQNKKAHLKNLSTNKEINTTFTAKNVMSYDGRIYIFEEGSVYEIQFTETPQNTLSSAKLIANVMPQSSQIFDGVVIQHMFKACFVSVFPEIGRHCQIRIKELENYKIVDAKFDRKVLMVIGADTKGVYHRFVIRFDDRYANYDIRQEKNITPSGLNFVVLDTNNCAHINEQEKLVIFKNNKDDSRATVIEDPSLGNHMKLYRWGSQAVFSAGTKLYRMKMK